MKTLRKNNPEVRLASLFLAVRFVPDTPLKKMLVHISRTGHQRRNRKVRLANFGFGGEWVIVEAIATPILTFLLGVYSSLAGAYLYDRLKRKGKRVPDAILEEVYEREVEESVVKYRKHLTKFKTGIPHEAERSQITRTYKSCLRIVKKLEDKERTLRSMRHSLSRYDKMTVTELKKYLRKHNS